MQNWFTIVRTQSLVLWKPATNALVPYWINARALALLYKKDVMNKQNRAVGTVWPLLTDTRIIRTPLYYGQFVWSQKCQESYHTDTSVKRTLGSAPFVSVLKRFDCGKNVLVVYQLLVKFRTRIATKTGQIIGSGELSSPVGLIHKKG